MSGELRHALVMAAGRGARMMPLTSVIPKPMAPYLGSTLIANGIRQIRKFVSHIHITVGYKGAMLAEHVITEGVDSVFNTSERGNAWWVYNTLMAQLNEPVLVLTSDNVVELEFDRISEEYHRLGAPACMVVPVTPVPGLDGDYIYLDGDVVTKLDRHHPSDRYCSGIQVINPAKVVAMTTRCDDFMELWGQLIAQRELKSSRIYVSRWFTVDTLEQLQLLNAQ